MFDKYILLVMVIFNPLNLVQLDSALDNDRVYWGGNKDYSFEWSIGFVFEAFGLQTLLFLFALLGLYLIYRTKSGFFKYVLIYVNAFLISVVFLFILIWLS